MIQWWTVDNSSKVDWKVIYFGERWKRSQQWQGKQPWSAHTESPLNFCFLSYISVCVWLLFTFWAVSKSFNVKYFIISLPFFEIEQYIKIPQCLPPSIPSALGICSKVCFLEWPIKTVRCETYSWIQSYLPTKHITSLWDLECCLFE